MGRRRKDREEFPLIAAVLGVLSLLNALRPHRRGLVRTAGRFAALIAGLIIGGSVLGLGVLLLIFAVLGNALGSNSGAGLLVCLAPATLAALAVWAILQSRSRGGQAAASTTSAQPAQAQSAAPPAAEPAAATARAAPAAIPTAPPIEVHAEPGARKPAEYRQRAVSYRRRIQSLIRNRRPGPFADRLNNVAAKLGSWEERVGQLADRLTLFENDELIQRDIREVPERINRLRRQIALEADGDMQAQMTRTLAAYEEQHRQLQALARVMRRTRLNLDDTLAAMGTIYSQAQVLNALDVDGTTAARIAEDIDHEVDRLNDLLSALSEINERPGPEVIPAAETGEDEAAGLSARKARLGRSST